MPRTIANQEGIHTPPSYSQTVVATGSRLAFVAGQVALDRAAPPAQVLLGVTSLALPELLVEIELVVSLP